MNEVREIIHEAIRQMGPQYSEEEKNQQEEILIKIFEQGLLPCEALEISEAMMEKIYAYAYRLYYSGKYEEANWAFKLLVNLNITEPKYSLGLGACHHKQKNYQWAIEAYLLSSYVDGCSPLPFYHAAECYLQLGEPSCAAMLLSSMVTKMGDTPEFEAIKGKAMLMLEALKCREHAEEGESP